MERKQINAITAIVASGAVLLDEPLSRHTTYGIGGPAEVFARPADRNEAAALLCYATDHRLPVCLLGSGSNCLVSDSGLPGITISLAGKLKDLRIQGTQVVAEAGVMLGHLVRRCLSEGLTGLESLIGIPGTLGGALVMNAGAFGGEIATHLRQVSVLTPAGAEKVYRKDQLEFAYRQSGFSPDELLIEARFEFPRGSAEQTTQARQASARRKASQPLQQRSAGSVFKNPGSDLAAGQLIDQAGLKGVRRGDAGISPKHANFFINHGQASAEDVAFLIKLAARTVKQLFGVQLQLEIKTLGFPPHYWKEAGLG